MAAHIKQQINASMDKMSSRVSPCEHCICQLLRYLACIGAPPPPQPRLNLQVHSDTKRQSVSERVREDGRSKRGAERESTETQNVTERKRESGRVCTKLIIFIHILTNICSTFNIILICISYFCFLIARS